MSYLNSNYYTKNVASEYRFDDFKNNIHFITDAKKFLTGDRLNYSVEEVNEMDKDEIINRVQKHFRFKSGNPTTIVKDLSYMDRDTVSQDEKEAYARLSFAFENTKGEGFMEAGTDYFVSEVVNPVNWASLVAGVFTGGTATVAMQTALKKGGTKAAQELLKQLNKKALKTSVIKGAVASGGTEGAISHFNEKMLENAGELIDEDYDYSLANVGISTGVGGVTGGVLGGLSGRQMVKSSSGVLDNFIQGEKIRKARNANADKLAQELLEKGYKLNKKTKKSGKNATLDKLTNSLAALDPDRVATGSDIKKAILENDSTFAVGNVTLDRLKRLTAAGFELSKKLDIERTRDGKPIRITEVIANALAVTDRRQTKKLKDINDVLNKYNITPEELSALYMAEFSEAGRILREAGVVSKLEKDELLKKSLSQLEILNNSRFVSLTGDELKNTMAAAELIYSPEVVKFLRWVNDTRIASMTSQVMTTVRNTTFGGAFLMLDTMDRVLEEAFLAASRDPKKRAQSQLFTNPQAIIKNMLFKRENNLALQALFEERLPVEFRNLFNKTAQAEIESPQIFGKGTILSPIARFGTHVNIFNAFSDHQFKRAVLMGTLDRQLARLNDPKLGRNLEEVMRNGTYNEIPLEYLQKGIQEAYRFSFQSQFGLKGEGTGSHFANKAIQTVKKTIILTAFTPFPRYVASQIQWINDYMPMSALFRLDKKGADATRKVKIRNAEGKIVTIEEPIVPVTRKTTQEAIARNITGIMPIAAGYFTAAERFKDGRETFEVVDPSDGTTVDIQANLGAAALSYYIGDLTWRIQHGLPVPSNERIIAQIALLSVGTDLRGGGNFYDDLIGGALKGDEKRLQKGLADVIATFTYPASTVKDLYGQFDQRSAMRPETLDPESSQFYNDNVNLLDYLGLGDRGADVLTAAFWNRVGRFLPDLPDDNFYGIPVTDPEYLNVQVFGNEMLQIEEDLSIVDGYDPRYFSPFAKHPLYVRDGLVKQTLGLTKSPPSSPLLKEMNMLAINQYDMYKRHTRSNFLDIVTRTSLSATLSDDFVKEVQYSEQYRSLSGFENKKNYLQDWIKNKIAQRITTVRELAQQGEFNVDKDYLSYVRGELSSLKEQKAFNEYLKNQSLNNGLSYTSVEEYFNALKDLDNASVSDQVWKAASVLSEVRSKFKQYQDRFLELPPSQVDAPYN